MRVDKKVAQKVDLLVVSMVATKADKMAALMAAKKVFVKVVQLAVVSVAEMVD